jgi:hypothetical protein
LGKSFYLRACLIAAVRLAREDKWDNSPRVAARSPDMAFLLLIEIEEIAWVYLESAGKLENVVYTDILLSPFHRGHEIAINFDHLAEFFLGKAALRAQGTKAFAER